MRDSSATWELNFQQQFLENKNSRFFSKVRVVIQCEAVLGNAEMRNMRRSCVGMRELKSRKTVLGSLGFFMNHPRSPVWCRLAVEATRDVRILQQSYDIMHLKYGRCFESGILFVVSLEQEPFYLGSFVGPLIFGNSHIPQHDMVTKYS